MEKTKIRNFIKMTIFAALYLYPVNNLYAQADSTANLTQYLFPHFDTSVMRLKNGEFSKAVMNYNSLTERMTFNQNGTLLDLIKPDVVDTICIQKRLFVPVENAFYEVILNASISCFVQHKSDLISEGRPAALGTTSQTSGVTSVSKLVGDRNSYNLKLPENFRVKSYEIYWVRINNVMHRFLNERQFLKIFPSKEVEIKNFINHSHLKINNYEDLKKLVNYCNELVR